MPFFKITNTATLAANATVTLTVNKPTAETRNKDYPYLDKHQITIDPGTYTAGTITVTATAIGGGSDEPVFESGSALVIDLAGANEPLTRKLEGFPVESFKFVGASMTGGSNDWKVTITSGF